MKKCTQNIYESIQKFDKWNNLKKELSAKEIKVLFKEGELWWVSIGYNLGEEVYGKGEKFRRPVLVFRKLTGDTCVAIPLTSKEKVGSWYHSFEVEGIKRWAMLHQTRIFSTKRFESRMTTISEKDFTEIKNAVGKFYNIF